MDLTCPPAHFPDPTFFHFYYIKLVYQPSSFKKKNRKKQWATAVLCSVFVDCTTPHFRVAVLPAAK